MKNVIESANTAPAKQLQAVADDGRVQIGGVLRLPSVKAPVEVADSGRVRIGGGMRLPPRRA